MDTRQKPLPLSDNIILTDSTPKPKLLDQVRGLLRVKHYSVRTERAYVFWIKRYIYFHQKRHPAEMGKDEVERFLSYLATTDKVAASAQSQALAALLFLYKQVLKVDLPWMQGIVRAKRPKRLPVVLTRDEVRRIFGQLEGTVGLFLRLLYGTGMRIHECVALRVTDLDFPRREIVVRQGNLLCAIAQMCSCTFALHARLEPWRQRRQKSVRSAIEAPRGT